MIISFCNEKGGAGKTTLAIHTATWLARQGRRVVLVDLDTQGGVSHFLGVPPAEDVAEVGAVPASRPAAGHNVFPDSLSGLLQPDAYSGIQRYW